MRSFPTTDDRHEGGVREEAEDLNQPLLTSSIESALSGFKPAEDGKFLIFRVFEPAGRRGDFALSLPDGWREGGAVTILKEPIERPGGPDLRPFELRSWRLVRG